MNHKWLFRIASLWNLGLALPVGAFPGYMLGLFGMPLEMTYPVFFYQFLALVGAFGIGYYWVSTDPAGNRAIIRLGILGKMVVFLTGLYWFIKGPQNGGCSWQVTILFAVDLVFAVWFMITLRSLNVSEQ